MAGPTTTEVARASVVLTPKFTGVAQAIRSELKKAGIAGLGSKAGDEWEKGFEKSAKADVPAPDSKKMQNQGKRAGSRFGGAMKVAIGAALAGLSIGAAFNFGKEIVGQASELEQQVGAVGAVFKENQGVVNSWAKSAASDFGLSQSEFSKMMSLMGSQLKNAGTPMKDLAGDTKNLISIGSDMAAQFGGTTTEAVEAISSALRGERDPIEKYGVSLTQAAIDAKAAELGFQKVGGTLSQEANAAATTALIMEQTADAHGAFGREANTFAGQQQRLTAQWTNMKATIGQALLPVMTSLFTWINTHGVPAVQNLIDGIVRFTQSQGFVSFMTGAKDVAVKLFSAFRTAAPYLGILSAAVLSYVAVQKISIGLSKLQALWLARQALVTKVVAFAQRGLNLAMTANPIGLIIAGIVLLVGAFILMYNKVGWFRDFVNAVWSGIKTATAAVVDWFTTTAVPAFQSALTWIGNVFTWLYNNIIKPIWTGIKIVIAVVVTAVMLYIKMWVWAFQNLLAPVFRWLYNAIIKPIFTGIAVVFNWIWNSVIKPVFNWIVGIITNQVVPTFQRFLARTQYVWAMIRLAFAMAWAFIKNNVLNPMISWIRDKIQPRFTMMKNTIQNVWNGVKNLLASGWNAMKSRVFDPLANLIKNTIPKAFETGKNAIGKAWDGVKDKAKTPVKFIIDTVYNKGIVGTWNKVADKFGIGKLSEFKPKGFRTGGRVYGPGTGTSDDVPAYLSRGEFVVNAKATRKHIGLLHAINGPKGANAPKFKNGMPALRSGGTLSDSAKWLQSKGARITEFGLWGQRVGRHSRGSWHYKKPGLAYDANYGPGGENATEKRFFDGILSEFKRKFPKVRVIWRAPGHYNHWHADASGGADMGDRSGGGGGGFDLGMFTSPFSKLIDKYTGKFGKSPWDQAGVKVMKKMVNTPIDWIKEKGSALLDLGEDLWNGAKERVVNGTAKAQGRTWALANNMPLTGARWKALNYIISRESSWNPKAKNPRSSASGLAQMITSTARAYAGTAPLSKLSVWKQLDAFMKYVKDRYGGVVPAMNFWKKHRYYKDGGEVTPTLYDSGGVLNPGTHLVANKTRKPEYILPSHVTDRLLKGDGEVQPIHITINGVNTDNASEVANELRFELQRLNRGGKYVGTH